MCVGAEEGFEGKCIGETENEETECGRGHLLRAGVGRPRGRLILFDAVFVCVFLLRGTRRQMAAVESKDVCGVSVPEGGLMNRHGECVLGWGGSVGVCVWMTAMWCAV